MYHNIPLSEIMTRDLTTLRPNDSMEKAHDLFKANDFHHLPVVAEDGTLQGIISKSDFLLMCDSMTIFRKEQEESHNLRFFKSLLAQEVMVKKMVELQVDNTALDAARLFRENLFHAIPIVNDKRELLGIVTTLDLINYAFQEPSAIAK